MEKEREGGEKRESERRKAVVLFGNRGSLRIRLINTA